MMSGTLDWTSITNIKENSCKKEECGCIEYFEIHQQTTIKLLSNHIKENLYKLEPGYEARARRISAIYARLFLELNLTVPVSKNTKPSSQMLGRFYWMGLGAFASKTMAMVFGASRSKVSYDSIPANINDFLRYTISSWTGWDLKELKPTDSLDILAKGNLWLAMDIIPWHLAWHQDSSSFRKCINSRDFTQFNSIKPTISNLPWSSEANIKIRNKESVPFGVTDEIKNAFNIKLSQIETKFRDPKNLSQNQKFIAAKDDLFNHLNFIAVQEQKNILQKICWSNESLRNGVHAQRDAWVIWSWMLISQTLVLSSEYDWKKVWLARKVHITETGGLPEDPWSTPPKGTVVEDLDSRLAWIVQAASKYHRLMQDEKGRGYLINELLIIAGWSESKAEGVVNATSNEGKR